MRGIFAYPDLNSDFLVYEDKTTLHLNLTIEKKR